jgi:hypothetical protein
MFRLRSVAFAVLLVLAGGCQQGSITDSCPDGILAGGQCYPRNCPGQACLESQACQNGICTEISCLGVDCPEGEACISGECQPCTPGCQGRECGPDPLCNTSCGECTLPKTCELPSGSCVCTPDCAGKCGGAADSCGGNCIGNCPSGHWCNEQACAVCNTATHCGSNCVNCASQASNQDCISDTCGCNGVEDCTTGQACYQSSCCTPNCNGKCGGAPNGCDGTCTANCPSGQWCNGQACAVCNVAAHCGSSCANCAAQASNKDCISGSCGCNGVEDCASGQTCYQSSCCTPNCTGKCGGASNGCGGTCTANCPSGQWCNGQACAACNVPAHCGSSCTNCTAQTNNADCVNGSCGCNGIEDCLPGRVCSAQSHCIEPHFRLDGALWVMGPNGDADAPYNTLRTTEGLFAYEANGSTWTWFGSTLDNLQRLGGTTISGGNNFDSCGAWLNGVYVDGSTIKGWYHAERDCHYPTTHKSIAYAQSSDGGRTFAKIGYPNNQIITADSQCQDPNYPITDTDDAGDPSIVHFGNFYYMYYLATCLNDILNWHIEVAQSPLGQGGPGQWSKYYSGSFSQSGLGGQGSALSGIGFTWVSWLDPASALMGLQYISGMAGAWDVGFSFSTDGITFHPMTYPAFAIEDMNWNRTSDAHELYAYPSLIALDGNREHLGDQFWFYFMYLKPGEGFDKRYMMRRFVDRVTPQEGDPLGNVSRISLDRFRNNSLNDDWVTTIIVNEPGYDYVSHLGYLLTSNVADTIEVTDCYYESWNDHMIGINGICEGMTYLRRLGFALTSGGTGRIAIYRCFNSSTTNHFVSTDPACEGYQTDFRIGYLLPN